MEFRVGDRIRSKNNPAESCSPFGTICEILDKGRCTVSFDCGCHTTEFFHTFDLVERKLNEVDKILEVLNNI